MTGRPAVVYAPLAPLRVERPVHRVPFLVERCRDRVVLDLGCYDETAPSKQGTQHWLHGALVPVARRLVGLDNSEAIPEAGLATGPASRIIRGDVARLAELDIDPSQFDVVVAGELIEHLPDALSFLHLIKERFPDRELIATTPNATSVTNGLLAALRRESTHHDHLQIYSYKTLHTLCLRAGFESWSIRPYHVYFTEMILAQRGLMRALVRMAQAGVNGLEWISPLWSGGLILHVTRI
jgi:SAM-dependent methyltransferase